MSANTDTPVLLEARGGILLITLNLPDKHNMLTPELIVRLNRALDQYSADDSLRVAILTGAGQQAFCAGGDLGRTLPLLTGARQPQDDWEQQIADDRELSARITGKGLALDKPIIAAVNGHCLAGGLEMLLGTDIRLSVAGASFGLPEVKLGLMPFAGALVRLPQQIGYANAMEMLLTGAPIGAERALQIGLINRIVESDDALLPEAFKLAEQIAANAPLAIKTVKATVQQCLGVDQASAFEIERINKEQVLASEDAREGTAAFIEKRPPHFTGY